MLRILGFVLAVVAGGAAAVLVATTVTASYDGASGERASCSTVITAAAVTDAPRPDLGAPADVREQEAVDAACHDALVDRSALAGLAVVVCVAAGSVVAFGRRPERLLATA